MVLPRRGRWLAMMIMVCVCLVPTLASAQSATLAWDPSPEATGYVLRWGTSVGVYPSSRNVGDVTTTNVSGLVPGVEYVAVVEAYDALGQFSEPSSPLTFVAPMTAPIGPVNDFNQDGSPDIVWQNTSNGLVSAWTMTGVRMTGAVLTNPGRVPDTNWRIVGSGHFNHDRNPDLVWQHRTQGYLAVWLMNGANLIDSASVTPGRVHDTNWKIAAVADMDGDGNSDFVWHEQSQGWIAIWLMDGVRLRASVGVTPERIPDTQWKIKGAGDLNGDGRADIIWQHEAQGWLAAWLMNATTLIDSVLLTPQRVSDPTWEIVGVADANNDGKADLYWRDRRQGYMAVWLMNGVTLDRSIGLAPEQLDDRNWRIGAIR